MQQQPTKPGAPCPVCGAEPRYRVWSIFMSGGDTRIDSKKHPFRGSEPIPLVCKVCGYVQLFVNPEDFRD